MSGLRKVKLTARTNRGKQLLRQHGDVWLVDLTANVVLFSNMRGPWLFLIPPTEASRSTVCSDAGRWVNSLNDFHFEVMDL